MAIGSYGGGGYETLFTWHKHARPTLTRREREIRRARKFMTPEERAKMSAKGVLHKTIDVTRRKKSKVTLAPINWGHGTGAD